MRRSNKPKQHLNGRMLDVKDAVSQLSSAQLHFGILGCLWAPEPTEFRSDKTAVELHTEKIVDGGNCWVATTTTSILYLCMQM